MKVYVVWGTNEDEEAERRVEPLHADLTAGGADGYLLSGLLQTFSGHVRELEPGGTLSLICTRGSRSTDESPNPVGTVASFVINNPGSEGRLADRHDWEFRVERRDALLPFMDKEA